MTNTSEVTTRVLPSFDTASNASRGFAQPRMGSVFSSTVWMSLMATIQIWLKLCFGYLTPPMSSCVSLAGHN